MMGGMDMSADVNTTLRTLLLTIFDLRVPEKDDVQYQIRRPSGLNITELNWLEILADAIVQEIQLNFDLLLKGEAEDAKVIEAWKASVPLGEHLERRKNYRLRIRTMIDDLFEEVFPLGEVTATIRAWKIQLTDACADAILTKFHLRPASSGPWASYRRTLYDVGQALHQALAHKDLFLMTGRASEILAMKQVLAETNEMIARLAREFEDLSQD